MIRSVANLSNSILASLKNEEGGRVALYHYLKNFCLPDDTVTPELINKFFWEALQITHWQSRKKDLYTDIIEMMQKFLSQSTEPFRMDHITDISRIQVINIESSEILYTVVKNFEQASQKEGENLRVIPESETRMLVLRRSANGDVTVRTYGPAARIVGDQVQTLGHDQELFYDAGLELLPNLFHRLRVQSHTQARFKLDSHGVKAQFVSGFAFRQNQAIHVTHLNNEPRIFFPLKRLERLYVQRNSDPYYMELLSNMDRALALLHNKSPNAQDFAVQVFDGGQIAFDQIFPDDKVLYTRLRELARWISSRAPGREL